jgi:hypothetical protein
MRATNRWCPWGALFCLLVFSSEHSGAAADLRANVLGHHAYAKQSETTQKPDKQ